MKLQVTFWILKAATLACWFVVQVSVLVCVCVCVYTCAHERQKKRPSLIQGATASVKSWGASDPQVLGRGSILTSPRRESDFPPKVSELKNEPFYWHVLAWWVPRTGRQEPSSLAHTEGTQGQLTCACTPVSSPSQSTPSTYHRPFSPLTQGRWSSFLELAFRGWTRRRSVLCGSRAWGLCWVWGSSWRQPCHSNWHQHRLLSIPWWVGPQPHKLRHLIGF